MSHPTKGRRATRAQSVFLPVLPNSFRATSAKASMVRPRKTNPMMIQMRRVDPIFSFTPFFEGSA